MHAWPYAFRFLLGSPRVTDPASCCTNLRRRRRKRARIRLRLPEKFLARNSTGRKTATLNSFTRSRKVGGGCIRRGTSSLFSLYISIRTRRASFRGRKKGRQQLTGNAAKSRVSLFPRVRDIICSASGASSLQFPGTRLYKHTRCVARTHDWFFSSRFPFRPSRLLRRDSDGDGAAFFLLTRTRNGVVFGRRRRTIADKHAAATLRTKAPHFAPASPSCCVAQAEKRFCLLLRAPLASN